MSKNIARTLITRKNVAASTLASIMVVAATAPVALAGTAVSNYDVNDNSNNNTFTQAHPVEKDVTLTTTGTESRVDVIAVNLNWTDATFAFNRGASVKTWNPATHTWTWTDPTSAGWTKSTGSVGITNHSSVGVTAALAEPVTSHGWTVSQEESAYIAAAYDGNDEAAGTAKTGSLNLVATGIPTADGPLTNHVTVNITPTGEN